VDAAKEDDMCPHSWAWGPCKTAETMERNRLYNRDHPHRESPESRKLGHIERRYAMARAYLDSPPVQLLAAA
jgi:hypothetical protein